MSTVQCCVDGTVLAGAHSAYTNRKIFFLSRPTERCTPSIDHRIGLISGPRPAGNPAGPAARGGKTDGRPTGTQPRTVAAIYSLRPIEGVVGKACPPHKHVSRASLSMGRREYCRSLITARLNAEQLAFTVCCQLAGAVEHLLLTVHCMHVSVPACVTKSSGSPNKHYCV
jgi:hypothetical protein